MTNNWGMYLFLVNRRGEVKLAIHILIFSLSHEDDINCVCWHVEIIGEVHRAMHQILASQLNKLVLVKSKVKRLHYVIIKQIMFENKLGIAFIPPTFNWITIS